MTRLKECVKYLWGWFAEVCYDEIASAAELLMNKSDGAPVAIVKGYLYRKEESKGIELAEVDLLVSIDT